MLCLTLQPVQREHPSSPAPRSHPSAMGMGPPLSLSPAEQVETQIPCPHMENTRGRDFSCHPKILVAWEGCGWEKL